MKPDGNPRRAYEAASKVDNNKTSSSRSRDRTTAKERPPESVAANQVSGINNRRNNHEDKTYPHRDASAARRRFVGRTPVLNMSPGTRTFYTLYSGSSRDAPLEENGETYLWRPDFDFFEDADPVVRPKDKEVPPEADENLNEFINQVATCLSLGRGRKLVIEPDYEVIGKELRDKDRCRVPTPDKQLSVMHHNTAFGFQSKPMESPLQDCMGPAVVLNPVRDAPYRCKEIPKFTSTLAQKFIKHPTSKWFNNRQPQLQLDVPICRKMLIWARMMLVNREDQNIMKQTGIYRGVLASLYRYHADPSLVAAFLTYWNIDGHTLITSQGEMGYPLHTISDAMGIPITGRLYEEFIPTSSEIHGNLKSLFAIYANLCPGEMQPGPGLVTLSDWLDHFFDDQADSFGISKSDGFADPRDPLLVKQYFHVKIQDDRPTAVLGNEMLTYRISYPSTLYRAAFIAAWLCTYCLPVETGRYIRPEVFIMAVKIAEGGRRAIGVASLAYLYRRLDNVHDNIASGTRSASQCSLFIPGHFIMGWFASFWKRARESASRYCPIKFAPFVIDLCNPKFTSIEEAHHIFWDFDNDGRRLRSLDFLGLSSLRFPEGSRPVCIRDGRTNHEGQPFVISISAMELLMSCCIGGVTHRRGEHFDNLVYCPHRFARIFNCDQLIPDFEYHAEDHVTHSLDFRSYSPTSRAESLQICLRRHLSYFRRPDGHTFFVQPFNRGVMCSSNYITWCNQSFDFLRAPEFFCDRIYMPSTIKTAEVARKEALVKTSGATSYPAADATSLGQNQKQKSPSPVPQQGQENTNVMQKCSGQEKTLVTSSSHVTPPEALTQPTPSSRESSSGDTEKVTASSDDESSSPSRDINSSNPYLFTGASTEDSLKDTPGKVVCDQAIAEETSTSELKTYQTPTEIGTGMPHQSAGATDSAPTPSVALPAQQESSREKEETSADTLKRKADDVGSICSSERKRKRTTETAGPELSAKSEKLWAEVEQVMNQYKMEASLTVNIGDKPSYGRFDAQESVSIPTLADTPSSRYIDYARRDLERFQSQIQKRPFNKDAVISEINGNIDLWGMWFKPTPPEIQKLLDGFSALREALTNDPQASAADVATEQEKMDRRANVIKASYDSVSAACSTMVRITKDLEEKLSSQDCRLHQHSARIQELQAKIEELNAQLKQAEDDFDQESLKKENMTNCLTLHNERLEKTIALKYDLEASSTQSNEQLQKFEEERAHLIDRDNEGLTRQVRSLIDFFMKCSFES